MNCEHCGWSGQNLRPAPKLEAPEGFPPLPDYDLHPPGKCRSKFKIGDPVFWNGGGLTEDLPPLRGRFLRLCEFHGPDFMFENGVWKLVNAPEPSLAAIEIDMSSVLDGHREQFEPDLSEVKAYPVAYRDLSLVAEWPIFLLD